MPNPTETYPGAPAPEDVVAYLGTDLSWEAEEVATALDAEATDQLNRCRFPRDLTGEPLFTPALAEALCRRVAHNLAVRSLPLGLQATLTDGAVATNQVGGSDAEVRRLEGPYRKRAVG